MWVQVPPSAPALFDRLMLRCSNFIENTIRKQSRSVLRRNIGEARRASIIAPFCGRLPTGERASTRCLAVKNSDPVRSRDRRAIRQFQFPESTDLPGVVKRGEIAVVSQLEIFSSIVDRRLPGKPNSGNLAVRVWVGLISTSRTIIAPLALSLPTILAFRSA